MAYVKFSSTVSMNFSIESFLGRKMQFFAISSSAVHFATPTRFTLTFRCRCRFSFQFSSCNILTCLERTTNVSRISFNPSFPRNSTRCETRVRRSARNATFFTEEIARARLLLFFVPDLSDFSTFFISRDTRSHNT